MDNRNSASLGFRPDSSGRLESIEAFVNTFFSLRLTNLVKEINRE